MNLKKIIMKKKINIKIENISYQVDENLTILEAAKKCGYEIPHLCYLKNKKCLNTNCQICLVEIVGMEHLVTSCSYLIFENINILIFSPRAINARKTVVDLLLSNHKMKCFQCNKKNNCLLIKIMQITKASCATYIGAKSVEILDETTNIIRDTSKCILCGRCIVACKEQNINILNLQQNGFNSIIKPIEKKNLNETKCIQCGKCVFVCPTGALTEKNDIFLVEKAFEEKKIVIAQIAPAVRTAIAEEFNKPFGTSGINKLVASLRHLGFYRIFDTNFGADLTVVEESYEFVNKINNNLKLPHITSCCPAWVKYVKNFYYDLYPYVSNCKSPHEMEGAIIKTYFAKEKKIDVNNIFVVSIMPCIAKKYECKLNENKTNNLFDVDAVLTTREVATLIKKHGISWEELPNDDCVDNDLIGKYSVAGAKFGITGGVTNAIIKTVFNLMTGKELQYNLNFKKKNNIKEASIFINKKKIKIAIVSGINNIKYILDNIRSNKKTYDFIEVMCCEGGCVNGNGQPYIKSLENNDYIQKRSEVIFIENKKTIINESHNNPDIKKLYKNFLLKKTPEIKLNKILHVIDSNK